MMVKKRMAVEPKILYKFLTKPKENIIEAPDMNKMWI
jgi:hypothetical protein